ncbi:hypothetical protein J6590_012906 [Homalodisca vitripennis]|nr:hypothetical protein J6590_012906 [Homalodisca vitripennis]
MGLVPVQWLRQSGLAGRAEHGAVIQSPATAVRGACHDLCVHESDCQIRHISALVGGQHLTRADSSFRASTIT